MHNELAFQSGGSTSQCTTTRQNYSAGGRLNYLFPPKSPLPMRLGEGLQLGHLCYSYCIPNYPTCLPDKARRLHAGPAFAVFFASVPTFILDYRLASN